MMHIKNKNHRYFDILGCQIYSIKDIIKLIQKFLPSVGINYNNKVDSHHYFKSPKIEKRLK